MRRRKMSNSELCEDCKDNTADYVVYLEGDEDWTKAYTKRLCHSCIEKSAYQGSVIETWTIDEWEREN